MWFFSLVTSVAIVFTWAFVFPQETRAIIAELKRQLRLWVIRYTGERAARDLARDFYQTAIQKDHDPELVKQVLDENWHIIRDRLGTPLANDILGEPSTLERYG